MRYAIIENGTVVNIVVAEPEYAAEMGWIAATEQACIGGTYSPETGFKWKEEDDETRT